MVVNGDPQDGLDAAGRARSGYRGEWHPLLATVEGPAGTWTMTAPDGGRYGVIRMLQLGGETGYRAVTWAEHSGDRELIGYYRTLRAAAAATHRRYLSRHGPRGLPPAGAAGTGAFPQPRPDPRSQSKSQPQPHPQPRPR